MENQMKNQNLYSILIPQVIIMFAWVEVIKIISKYRILRGAAQSAVAQLVECSTLGRRALVLGSREALHCVLEQDTFSSA